MVGERNIYLLDIEDIENYFGGEYDAEDLWMFFFNETDISDGPSPAPIALRSSSGNIVYSFKSQTGVISTSNTNIAMSRMPAFQIDLSKISWSSGVANALTPVIVSYPQEATYVVGDFSVNITENLTESPRL